MMKCMDGSIYVSMCTDACLSRSKSKREWMEPGLIHAQLASGQTLGSLILNLCPHNYMGIFVASRQQLSQWDGCTPDGLVFVHVLSANGEIIIKENCFLARAEGCHWLFFLAPAELLCIFGMPAWPAQFPKHNFLIPPCVNQMCCFEYLSKFMFTHIWRVALETTVFKLKNSGLLFLYCSFRMAGMPSLGKKEAGA